MKTIYLTILSLLTISIVSCTKQGQRDLQDPPAFVIQPTFHGSMLSATDLSNTVLTYQPSLNSAHEENVGDFGRSAGTGYQYGYLWSPNDVAFLSGGQNIKVFHLRFPDGVVKTLTIDYGTVSESDARTIPCYCLHPQIRILVDNVAAPIVGYTADKTPVYGVSK